jgi:hypothetical protein
MEAKVLGPSAAEKAKLERIELELQKAKLD